MITLLVILFDLKYLSSNVPNSRLEWKIYFSEKMSKYKLNPLNIGAEVFGLDLSKQVSTETKEIIKKDVSQHRILVFRNQRRNIDYRAKSLKKNIFRPIPLLPIIVYTFKNWSINRVKFNIKHFLNSTVITTTLRLSKSSVHLPAHNSVLENIEQK